MNHIDIDEADIICSKCFKILHKFKADRITYLKCPRCECIIVNTNDIKQVIEWIKIEEKAISNLKNYVYF